MGNFEAYIGLEYCLCSSAIGSVFEVGAWCACREEEQFSKRLDGDK